MLIFSKRIQIVLGILLITLLQPMAWGEGGSPERLPAKVTSALSENQTSAEPGSSARVDSAANRTVTNESDTGSVQGGFGDGRGGFWIVGILINLSVLGWFLAWAVKEWRKKRDD